MPQRLIDFNGLKAVVEKIYADIKLKADAVHEHAPENIKFTDGKTLVEKLAEIQAGGEDSLEGYATEAYVDEKIGEVNTALEGKVDKEEGKVLIAQTEVERLALVDNYDDSAVVGRLDTLEAIDHSQFLTEHQDISGLATKEEVQAVDAKIGVQAVEAAEGVDPVEATGLYKYVDDKVAAVEYEVATAEELIAMYEEIKNA